MGLVAHAVLSSVVPVWGLQSRTDTDSPISREVEGRICVCVCVCAGVGVQEQDCPARSCSSESIEGTANWWNG